MKIEGVYTPSIFYMRRLTNKFILLPKKLTLRERASTRFVVFMIE